MRTRAIQFCTALAFSALCATPATAQQPFAYDGCGVIINDGCSKLVDDATGDEYTGDFTPFAIGDHVHVVGWASFSFFNCPSPIDGEFDQAGGYISLIELCADLDPSTPFCYGDGLAGVDCPCTNDGAFGEGCGNSQGHGAILSATGSALYANDDLVMHVSQGRPMMPSILLQGVTQIATPFRDGIYCMGNPTVRMEVVILDASGAGSSAESIVTNGSVPGPGTTRHYQQWYRDPNLTPCGTGSNFTNGVSIDWI